MKMSKDWRMKMDLVKRLPSIKAALVTAEPNLPYNILIIDVLFAQLLSASIGASKSK